MFPPKSGTVLALFFLNSFVSSFLLAALDPHGSARALPGCREQGLLFITLRGLLVAVAYLLGSAAHGILQTRDGTRVPCCTVDS